MSIHVSATKYEETDSATVEKLDTQHHVTAIQFIE